MSIADAYEKVKDACCTVILNGGSGICSGAFVENASNVPGIFVSCAHCVITVPSATIELKGSGHTHTVDIRTDAPEILALFEAASANSLNNNNNNINSNKNTAQLIVKSSPSGNGHTHEILLTASDSSSLKVSSVSLGSTFATTPASGGHTHTATIERTALNTVNLAVKNINGVKGDHRILPAQVLGYSAQADVAVLWAPDITRDHPTVPFLLPTDPEYIRTGDPLFVVGNPAGRDDTSCSPGWVRDNNYEYSAFRTTDVYLNAPTTFGNSGSPVFDLKGRVVSNLSYGPNAPSGDAVETEGGGARSNFLKFVVDAFAADKLVPGRNDRIVNNRFLCPYMGLEGFTTDSQNAIQFNIKRLQGYIITKTNPDSPFFPAWGDGTDVLLLEADGKPLGQIAGQTKLSDIVFFKNRNSTLTVLWRYINSPDGSLKTSTVTFTKFISVELDDYGNFRELKDVSATKKEKKDKKEKEEAKEDEAKIIVSKKNVDSSSSCAKITKNSFSF